MRAQWLAFEVSAVEAGTCFTVCGPSGRGSGSYQERVNASHYSFVKSMQFFKLADDSRGLTEIQNLNALILIAYFE